MEERWSLQTSCREQYSLREIALLYSNKPTSDCIASTLRMFIDAVNLKSLKAWYKDYCNYVHSFTATEENADEIYIKHTDFIEYLYSIFDELIKENLGYTEKCLFR